MIGSSARAGIGTGSIKIQESENLVSRHGNCPTSIMVAVPTVQVNSGQWSRYLYAAADLRAYVNRAVCGYHNRRLPNSERAALTGAGNDYQLREAFWRKRRHTTSGQHRSENKTWNSFLDMFMADEPYPNTFCDLICTNTDRAAGLGCTAIW